MSSEKTPQNQNDGEMTKLGVSCKCSEGLRPTDGEMTKLASGAHQCPNCGKAWGQAPAKGSKNP